MKKKNLFPYLLVVGICLIDFFASAGYLFLKSQNGTLLHLKDVSDNIFPYTLQTLICITVPVILFIVYMVILKKEFLTRMFFRIEKRYQVYAVIILTVVIAGVLGYGLITKQDKIYVVYSLPYYFMVAFTEEFVVRDVCTDILRDYKWQVRFILPNLCFAFLHLFSYAGWGDITSEYLFEFLRSDMPQVFVIGCVLQLVKEKSGTIWIPILIHTLWNYFLG